MNQKKSDTQNKNDHRVSGSRSNVDSGASETRQGLNDTRQRLVRLIAEHQLAHPGKKLQIGVLSEQCGISRQAFNRYYDDLKPYASGLKPVAELLVGTDDSDTAELLNQSHSTVLELNKKLEMQRRQFESEVAKIETTYITSLMNDDLLKFNTNELRQTLERTVIHSEQLSRQVDNLKLDLIKEQQKARTAPAIKSAPSVQKTIIDPDLSRVFEAYSKTGDEDKLDADKQRVLYEALDQVNRLCRTCDTVVVIFAERYLSSFQRFADAFIPQPGKMEGKPHVIVRLPIFNRSAFTGCTGRIKAASVQVYIPACTNPAIQKSQRFRFRNIPVDELKAADGAHTVPLSDTVHLVCTYLVNEGD